MDIQFTKLTEPSSEIAEILNKRDNDLSLVLGTHTGPSMVGVAYAPLDAFADMP
jgi:hypothetical protein